MLKKRATGMPKADGAGMKQKSSFISSTWIMAAGFEKRPNRPPALPGCKIAGPARLPSPGGMAADRKSIH
ncbi:hypothetical protein DESUT3_30970 [Desulfuromonas versatilis]|uniref:Uncharacterized protein n=1 Tax=Desulfuromonas versatilis TaxID=2802975 RepID=A0ABM8HZ16_9BACT|nr:hypothetical protein [Desulfuromonas versatilis]BCR06028.1 hypothetical protein DESUT3_30970 [Desulfuromonas versatilis]